MSSDVNADNNLATVAGQAITANTITANNALGLAGGVAGNSLTVANNALGQALDFAEMETTQSNEVANNATQAGENFAALASGANPNNVAQPTQTITGTGSDGFTTLLLIAGVLIAAVTLFKSP
jgi:hypothetical protein